MTIDKLTGEKRASLVRHAAGPDAIRVIDALTAEIERLRAELAGKAGYDVWMRAAKELGAEKDALTAEIERLQRTPARKRELQALARLAEATALLTEWIETADEQELNAAPYEQTSAFLANQPAAPRCGQTEARAPGFVLSYFEQNERMDKEAKHIEHPTNPPAAPTHTGCNCPRDNMYDSSRTGWREDCPKHGIEPAARRGLKP